MLAVSKCLVRDGHRVIIITESQSDGRVLEKWQKDLNWQEGYMSANLTGQSKNIVISSYFDVKKNKITNSLKSRDQEDSFIKNDKNRVFSIPNVPSIIVYRLPKVNLGWTKKFNIWVELWKNRELIRMSDIVHAHDVYFWYFPFRVIFHQKPSYITFHGYEGVYPLSKKAVFIRKLSEKLASGNICVGDFIKKWYGTKPTLVTYGGVDSDRHAELVSASSARKAKIPKRVRDDKQLKVLFVGRLEQDTGLPLYLEGLSLLTEAKKPFEFEVCGDGSLRSEAEKYGTVYGFVKDPEEYIAQADIVFVSSYLAILQALKYGKVVVAVYDNPLKEDYLKMTPYANWIQIVNTGIGVFKNIEQYDKISQENIRKGEDWVRSQTWDKLTEKYYSLWQV